MTDKKINKKIGFTLVESLVAISILMVAVASPMAIAQKGLASAIYSEDQMTATFLAQDAIEFIKNKRDEIGLKKDPLDTNVTDWLSSNSTLAICLYPYSCNIDTISGQSYPSNSNSGNPLRITRSSDSSFLKYDLSTISSEYSKFTRNITIVKSQSNPDEAEITVDVIWSSKGNQEKIELQDFIYNYWENLGNII